MGKPNKCKECGKPCNGRYCLGCWMKRTSKRNCWGCGKRMSRAAKRRPLCRGCFNRLKVQPGALLPTLAQGWKPPKHNPFKLLRQQA